MLQWLRRQCKGGSQPLPGPLGCCVKGQPAGILVTSRKGSRWAPLGSLVGSRYQTGARGWEGGAHQQADSAVGAVEGHVSRTLGRRGTWKCRLRMMSVKSSMILRYKKILFFTFLHKIKSGSEFISLADRMSQSVIFGRLSPGKSISTPGTKICQRESLGKGGKWFWVSQ